MGEGPSRPRDLLSGKSQVPQQTSKVPFALINFGDYLVNQALTSLDAEICIGYAPSAMHSSTGPWVGAALLTFAFFVMVPAIAAAIGYAAWKGKPKTFDREMYWTAFAAAIGVSCFLMVFAQRMNADVRTWQYLVQLALFGLGALLFGVAGGCMIGIFTYRRGVKNQDSPS